MKSRRELLLGMVAGAIGSALLSARASAWYYEELTADQAAALAARACRAAPSGKPEDHVSLIASARKDLLQRIGQGLLPASASEQVGCPVCGCSFVVTAEGAR